jgi:molybdenum cofactor cytidylyltransferase
VRELAGKSPVLATTSTKLALDESDLTDRHKIVEDAGGLITILSDWNRDENLLLTGPQLADESKWDGLSLAQLQDVIEFSREKKVILLIEADGAGGRSLKAPAAHEPALPHNLDLLVPVLGVDAVGEVLGSKLVHRKDEIQGALGLADDERLSVEHIARLLRHPSGGLKALPLHAELKVLINKVESDAQLENAKQIARLALEEHKIRSVVVGAVQRNDPVRLVRSQVAAIVLAAGESKRFKSNKLLQVWRGKPLLEHVLDAVRASKVQRRVLVLGHDQQGVLASVNHEGFQIVHNAEWKQGQSTSVKAGFEALEGQIEAALFPLGDMPLVDAALIDRLVDHHAETLAPIIAPRIDAEWGNPVLFDQVTFPAFSELSGDRGAKTLFSAFEVLPVTADAGARFDVDTKQDLNDPDV